MSLLMGLFLQLFYFLVSFVTWYTIDKVVSTTDTFVLLLTLLTVYRAVERSSSGWPLECVLSWSAKQSA